jgi:Trk K+ transport system NAD-binding subunit
VGGDLSRARDQRRHRRVRAIRAFFLLPGSRNYVALVLAFVAVFIAAWIELDLQYKPPTEGGGLDTFEALYATIGLLFFANSYALPPDALTRTVFFLVPALGLAVLGQGVARASAALLKRERWEKAMAATYSDHVIVCGLGRIGFRVVRWLLDLGQDVVVVDNVADNTLVDQVRAWGVPVVVGDAKRPDLLEQLGVRGAAALLPVTSDDVTNLTIATEARRLNPDLRVVLRVFDDRLAANLQSGFDIHFAFSMSAIAAPAFAAAATRSPVDYAFSFGEGEDKGLLTITKFTIVEGSKLVGYRIEQIEDEFGVVVLAHRHDHFDSHPPRDAMVAPGEGIVVSGSLDALSEVAKYAPPTRELHRFEQGGLSIQP